MEFCLEAQATLGWIFFLIKSNKSHKIHIKSEVTGGKIKKNHDDKPLILSAIHFIYSQIEGPLINSFDLRNDLRT